MARKRTSDQPVDGGSEWALGKVKERTGDETPNFEAVLLRNGKPAAHVQNHGCGGCCEWHWLDDAARKAFAAHAKAKYPDDKFELEDRAVYDMLDERALRKKFDRTYKGAVMFTVVGKSGVWRGTMRGRTLEQALASYRTETTKQKLKIDKIINDLPVEEAWRLWLAEVVKE